MYLNIIIIDSRVCAMCLGVNYIEMRKNTGKLDIFDCFLFYIKIKNEKFAFDKSRTKIKKNIDKINTLHQQAVLIAAHMERFKSMDFIQHLLLSFVFYNIAFLH